MKIAVCVKQVPVVSLLKFDEETKRLVREGVPSEVNPFDVLAMSAAAQLKESAGAEVVVFTMGPPAAREALRQCLAMGADRGVHLLDMAFAGSDTLATARALAAALERESPSIVLCGLNSVDAETGQVGPEIAELMGIPHIGAVQRLELSGDGAELVAERLTDTGHEVVSCSLPALVTVTEGVAPEVYPSNEAMEAAEAGPIAELTAADLGGDVSRFGVEGSPTAVSGIEPVDFDRERIVIRNTPVGQAVDEVMAFLDARGVFKESVASDGAEPRGPRLSRGAAGSVWVFAETSEGRTVRATLELLGRARALASAIDSNVEAVLLGDGVEPLAAELAAYGADRVLMASDDGLKDLDSEVCAAALAEAVEAEKPYAFLFPSNIFCRDVASRLAARLSLGLTGDCVGLDVDSEGRLVQMKPAFGGNVVAPILSKTMPQMATVRPGILSAAAPDWSVEPVVHRLLVHRLQVGALPEPRVWVLESFSNVSPQDAAIEHADAIVAVGMGLGSPDNIVMARDLAHALGGVVGATRDVVDAGWLPRQVQIGLSGKAVSPRLYVALGIRGPYNHTVGIRKAGTVVAVNSNARAPIFRSADIGVVADCAEVVPALTAAVKNHRIAKSV
jgi:electron transfer flavoprotein alpha subunit